jgi:hypothetical protein
MRTIIAVLCLVVGVLVGQVLRPAPTQAQSAGWFAFNIGETVRLSTELPQGVVICKVTQVQNGFVGCAASQQQPDRWVNLRIVKEITPQRER